MRHYSLHKFLALLLVAIGSVTVAIAQNVAKIGSTEYATLKEAVDAVQTGAKGYIYILGDASFEDLRIEGKQIIINLKNYTVKGNKIDVYGKEGVDTYLRILDSKAKGLSVDAKNNYAVSYTNAGTLQLTRSITAYEGAKIIVESGKVVSTKNSALFAMGDVTGQKDITSSVEITGGYVKAQECCASPQGRGATVTVNGTAVLESLDNAVVAGNGTNTATKKLGGTSITIVGKCWLIGRIQTAGYAACGIYHPQQGTLTIKYSRGIPNIVAVNGAGIVMRGGTLDYRAGNITATGDANFTGKVGDSRVVVGTSGIVYDRDCNYYDVANAKIAISDNSGEKKVVGAKSAIEVVNENNQAVDNVFDIQGGTFSSDVSAYINTVDGREVFEHEGTYYVGKFKAQIKGGLKYETALTAINKAPAGSTVVLLKDCSATGSAPNISKNVTIDLNGKNLIFSSMTVEKGGNLTIKDSGTGGTYNGLGANYSVRVKQGGIFNLESGTLTNSSTATGTSNVVVRVEGGTATTPAASTANIKGGKIESKGTPVFVRDPGATVNVSGGELVSNGLACIAGNGSEGMGGTNINISGGTLTAKPYDATSAACGIYHPNEGTLKITGGTINVTDGVGVLMRGGDMTMTGGEINATGDATRTGSVGDANQKIGVSGVIFDRDANYPYAATTSIKIDGDAKVNGAKEAVELKNENNVADAKDAIKLLGGTYNKDVQSLLADGSVSVEQGGTYVVSTFYAQVGETKYASLQEAINAATAGQTVTLIHDVDMTPLNGNRILRGIEIGEGKDVVLDMNGHSILGVNANGGNIEVTSGKLTLKDSKENSTGRIYTETPYNVSGFLYSTPIVNVTDGEFVMESGHIYTVIPENTAANGQYGVGAWGSSKITINGGTIESGWYAIAGNGNETKSTTITINGGTLVSTADYAIYHPQPGKLTVNDGAVIYGQAGAIAMKKGELEVNGGTLTSKGKGNTGNWGDGTGGLGNAALNFCKPYGNVSATIKGGTITAEGDAVVIDAKPTAGKEVTLAISGGTYSSDVSQYCVEGFTATPNTDGTYGISEVGDGMIIVYDKTSDKVAANGSVTIDLDQINKVSLTKEVAGVTTTLTKDFKNTGWNAFFVPFDFTLTQEMLDAFDFAKLYAITLKNGSGSQLLSYVEANDGDKIKAYFPCLIKAKVKGVQSLNVGSVSYKPITEMKPVTTTSTIELFTFYPVMENTCIAAKNGYYLNSEKNSFVYNENAEAYIPPFRYYMTIQNRDDYSYILPTDGKASVVEFRVIGADEVTGITDVEGAAAMEAGKVYNLQGVVVGDSVENLPKGIYIRNGRKVVVK